MRTAKSLKKKHLIKVEVRVPTSRREIIKPYRRPSLARDRAIRTKLGHKQEMRL